MKNLENYPKNILNLINGGGINDEFVRLYCVCMDFCKRERPDSTPAIKVTTLLRDKIIYQSENYRPIF